MRTIVFGASGVVGRAAAEHLAGLEGGSVIGVSRRSPDVTGVDHLALDLGDHDEAARVLGGPRGEGTTHVVFAALQEGPDLVAGWRDAALMARNLDLFRHALEPLVEHHGRSLVHVTLLQGAKAYGLHVGRAPLPAKERLPRDDHENFYFLQEDALRSLASGQSWSWTVLRPQVVYGESVGSPMNLIPAIGAYAALEAAAGRPLSFPGGAPMLQEAVDAGLLARAIAWAGTSAAARGEVFNVTNGDVFDWFDLWPAIADALAMESGPPAPQRLAEAMPPRADEWAAVVDRHHLMSPRSLHTFVGGSWTYADILFGSLGRTRPRPALLSTIKIREAGFADCIDTEDMFRAWFERFRARRLLPDS